MTPKIHPAAHVDPHAEIGPGCVIGPGAVVEAGAVLGPDCRIAPNVIITRHVRMGRNNRVGPGAVLGADPQVIGFDRATESAVEIGDDNEIRELVTLHRGSKPGGVTRVGDANYLMVGVHLGHDVQLGNQAILANNALFGGHVVIGDRVVVGGGSVFHQFVRIGRLAMVQGASGIGKDIPPFTVACRVNRVAGLNIIGLRRAGLDAAARTEIKRAFGLLYRSGLNLSQALAAAAAETWGEPGAEFFRFVAEAKRRGICAPLGRGAEETASE